MNTNERPSRPKVNKKPRKLRPSAVPDEVIALALVAYHGKQYLAAEHVGLSGATVSERIQKSPYLQAVVKQAREKLLDEMEESLRMQAIDRNNITATIFYLKTKGKERGYQETSQLVVSPEYKDAVDNTLLLVSRAQDERKQSKIIDIKP